MSLLALAAGLWRRERVFAVAAAAYAEDTGELDHLLAGRSALETSVLESRAGIQLNFDAVDRAVLVLRAASSEASVVRGRGVAYAEAADELDRTAEQLPSLETSVEEERTS